MTGEILARILTEDFAGIRSRDHGSAMMAGKSWLLRESLRADVTKPRRREFYAFGILARFNTRTGGYQRNSTPRDW